METIEIIKKDADGNEVRVPAPAEVQEQAQVQEEAEVAAIAEANDILSLLAPETETLVVEKEIEVAGQKRKFFVKKLGYTDCARIDAKKYRRGANGQISRDLLFEETNGMAWQLHEALVKDANAGKVDAQGKTLPPLWQPLFSIEQIMGKNGLFSNPQAKTFIYQLCQIIWEEIPELSPLLAAQAASQLGMA
jgi:hypothetical protein